MLQNKEFNNLVLIFPNLSFHSLSFFLTSEMIMWTTEENSRRNHDDSKATFNYIKFIFFSQTSILLEYKNTAEEVTAREKN